MTAVGLSPKAVEAFKLLRDTIAKEETPFSIQHQIFYPMTRNPDDAPKGACETPACILGWADHLGLKEYFGVDQPMGLLCAPEFHNIITPHVQLPDGSHRTHDENPEWFTKARTVAMLDKFIETGEIDWLTLDNSE